MATDDDDDDDTEKRGRLRRSVRDCSGRLFAKFRRAAVRLLSALGALELMWMNFPAPCYPARWAILEDAAQPLDSRGSEKAAPARVLLSYGTSALTTDPLALWPRSGHEFGSVLRELNLQYLRSR